MFYKRTNLYGDVPSVFIHVHRYEVLSDDATRIEYERGVGRFAVRLSSGIIMALCMRAYASWGVQLTTKRQIGYFR